MPLTQMKNLTHLALAKLGLPDVVLDALLSSLPNLTSLGTFVLRLRLEKRDRLSSHTAPQISPRWNTCPMTLVKCSSLRAAICYLWH